MKDWKTLLVAVAVLLGAFAAACIVAFAYSEVEQVLIAVFLAYISLLLSMWLAYISNRETTKRLDAIAKKLNIEEQSLP